MVLVGHPRLPALAAHVFVDDLDALVLSDDDAHHLMRVLRLREGESLTASDGVGGWRRCVVSGGGLVADGDIAIAQAPTQPVTVGFALTKGDKPEFTVQKLTEIGVDRIVPLHAARSIVKWEPDKAARNVARWRSVARAAAMQSRRVWLPEVTDVMAPRDLSGGAFAHPGGVPLGLDHGCVAVGPEGGWTDDEVAGSVCVDLGPTTLRAETAAVAAAVLLVGLRDSRIRPAEMPVSPD
jgi:16S rRNA (uracil1498-N3)-methyltransferase